MDEPPDVSWTDEGYNGPVNDPVPSTPSLTSRFFGNSRRESVDRSTVMVLQDRVRHTERRILELTELVVKLTQKVLPLEAEVTQLKAAQDSQLSEQIACTTDFTFDERPE